MTTAQTIFDYSRGVLIPLPQANDNRIEPAMEWLLSEIAKRGES